MRIFETSDYRKFLEDLIKSRPKRGHGYKLKIAEALRVHPTLVTQVLKGQKSFTSEQGISVAGFIGLNDLEKDYFLGLIDLDRAGSVELRSFINSRLLKLKQENEKVKSRILKYDSMSESDQAVFYSHWYYSAIRLSSGINKNVTRETLSEDLDLPIELVDQVLKFLISRQLVVEKEDKTLNRGFQNTFLPAESPLVSRHHMNWRLKAIEKHPKLENEELAFSSPLTIDKNDIPEIKKMCLELIQNVSKKVSTSSSEKLACLNIDWFVV